MAKPKPREARARAIRHDTRPTDETADRRPAHRRDRVRGHRPPVHDRGRYDRERPSEASGLRRHDDPVWGVHEASRQNEQEGRNGREEPRANIGTGGKARFHTSTAVTDLCECGHFCSQYKCDTDNKTCCKCSRSRSPEIQRDAGPSSRAGRACSQWRTPCSSAAATSPSGSVTITIVTAPRSRRTRNSWSARSESPRRSDPSRATTAETRAILDLK
jgi:hypothetical protein